MNRYACIAVFVLLAAGCGSGSSSKSTSTSEGSASPRSTTSDRGATNGSSADALTAEAQSAAAGDIPDNQVFLDHVDDGNGYAMKYPEGWAVAVNGRTTTIQDKNNVIRIAVTQGATPTIQSIAADMERLRASAASLTSEAPQEHPACQNGSAHPEVKAAAFHVVYHTQSAPNSVTGKRTVLDVDRYYYPNAGKVAIVDFGTPHGVDNVDAYCQMAVSFRWT